MTCGQCRYFNEGECFRFPPDVGGERPRVLISAIACGEFRTPLPHYDRKEHIKDTIGCNSSSLNYKINRDIKEKESNNA